MWNVKLTLQIAGRIEQNRDDPHRLLGIIGTMAQRIGGRRDQVQRLERAFAGHVQRTQRLAGAEQAFAGLQRPAVAHDGVQLLQVGAADAGAAHGQHHQHQPGQVELALCVHAGLRQPRM